MTAANPRPADQPQRGPLPGTTGRPKAEIARIAIDAQAKGQRMSTAVAAHYGCGERAASAAISRARREGHPIPSDRIRGATRQPHGSVAAYRRHLRGGQEPCPECAPLAQESRRQSIRHAAVARRRQESMPAPQPTSGRGVVAVAVASARTSAVVVECACGWSVPVHSYQPGQAMRRHTLTAHRRPATTGERTPKVAA